MDSSAGTKSISSEELKDYLHLPAKEVAKNLGICLTSLKKVCRQHGIKRWPYRRLKSIEKKIQSLESSMGQGDGEDLKRQIDQLHSEKALLPSSYGTNGSTSERTVYGRDSPAMGSLDSIPSSPLSCASTTLDALAGHDDCSRSPTPGAHSSSPSSHCCPSVASRDVAVPGSMTAAAALVCGTAQRPSVSGPSQSKTASFAKSTPTPLRSQVTRSSSSGASARQGATISAVNPDKSALKLEVELPPHVAEMMAQGAKMTVQVQQAGGQARLHIEPKDGPLVVLDVASLATQAVEDHLKKNELEREQLLELSDDDMINALAGCASEKVSPRAEEEEEEEGETEMSDAEIVLALAGCVETKKDGEEETYRSQTAVDIFSIAGQEGVMPLSVAEEDGAIPWFERFVDEPHNAEHADFDKHFTRADPAFDTLVVLPNFLCPNMEIDTVA